MYQFKQAKKKLREYLKVDFNTSHVSVQGSLPVAVVIKRDYFNTSHVSVQAHQVERFLQVVTYFNTSHVSVQDDAMSKMDKAKLFQYISCISSRRYRWKVFTIIQISIHLMYQFKLKD